MKTRERNKSPTLAERSAATAAFFSDNWSLYRKVVRDNFFFQQQAAAALRTLLTEEMDRPFRFLDMACGTADCSADALRGTRVVEYRGIDASPRSLRLAADTLHGLPCEITLEQADFAGSAWEKPDVADVGWIGLGLHHLRGPRKLGILRALRRVLSAHGSLVVYEPTTREGETRATWLERFDLQRLCWPGYTDAEWALMSAHVHAADFPSPTRPGVASASRPALPASVGCSPRRPTCSASTASTSRPAGAPCRKRGGRTPAGVRRGAARSGRREW